MKEYEADVIIIGSGPSGQKAAIQCAKLGKKVIVIEKLPDPGGHCLYSGTIPSKTLREAIIDLTRFHERYFHEEERRIPAISTEQLTGRLQKVTKDEREMVRRQFRKNNIEIVQGTASFEDPHALKIADGEGAPIARVKGDKCIIAVGSKPRNPLHVPFDEDVILDSTRLLGLKQIPKTMVVLGGGIIGAEYASFFSALGTEVTIIDKKDHLLPLLDAEIGIHLQSALTEIGLKFMGKKKPAEIARVEDRAFVRFEDGTSVTADVLLYALGRTANADVLKVEKIGIELDERGYIPVSPFFQTEQKNIYAVGDVIGGPCLASTSMEQGRLAARHACGAETHRFPTFYPIGIYAIPEVSCCGYTEEQLKELGFRYLVGRAYYYELARSHIAGSKVGLFKILFHADTLEILGIHIVGRGATEVIHIGQVAMSFSAKLDYFVQHIFNYPTYAEGYRVAALNGLNKIPRKR